MKKINFKLLGIAICFFATFVVWTFLVRIVDVQCIGPLGSSVGFATINRCIHNAIGIHWGLYRLTDWLGLIPIIFGTAFAIFGFVQLIKRKKFLRVDYSILTLGIFYILVAMAYLLFELIAVNCRPILINGYMEVSYPSSTTMLAMCVMPTSMMQFNTRVNNLKLRRWINMLLATFTGFMVIGRLLSGVHWFTDIVGGMLISASLVLAYYAVNDFKR